MWLGWPSSRDLHPGLYDVASVGAPSEKGCGLVGRYPGICIPGFTMSPPLGNAVRDFSGRKIHDLRIEVVGPRSRTR